METDTPIYSDEWLAGEWGKIAGAAIAVTTSPYFVTAYGGELAILRLYSHYRGHGCVLRFDVTPEGLRAKALTRARLGAVVILDETTKRRETESCSI